MNLKIAKVTYFFNLQNSNKQKNPSMEKSSKNEFSLNQQNFNDIPFEKYNQDFTFIVNGKEYQTSRVVADILSPYIRQLHFSDESTNEFTINTQEPNNEINYFQEFLQLANCHATSLDLPKQTLFCSYFLQLGNISEYLRLHPKFSEKISSANIISLLKELDILSKFSINIINSNSYCINEKVREIINYASSHFDELDKSELMKMSNAVLELIVSSGHIKLKDEDTLFDFVHDLCTRDDRYSYLYEYVAFANISKKSLETFFTSFNIEYLSRSIWESIGNRFNSLHDVRNTTKEEQLKEEVKTFEKDDRKEFEGIMRYLTRTSGGNIHDNKTIDITSNSIYGSCYPRNAVDYDNIYNYYFSLDDGNAFICFDFKEKLVRLKSYSIKTCNNEPYTYHLKSWVIEVSNDGKEWKEIDRRSDETSMNQRFVTVSFDVREQSDYSRYIRLRQTGQSWCEDGNHSKFLFHLIEFYGQLKERSD